MIEREYISNGTIGRAIFSDDLKYRYVLTREWDDSPWINFILLNPSTGDERNLETTTAGVQKRAKSWGYGGMMVVNLFGLIATNPKDLRTASDPVGSSADWAIEYMLKFARANSEPIVCAWGNHGSIKNRDAQVLELLKGEPLQTLGLNKNGSPKHPLHMAHHIEPEPWNHE